MSAGEDDLVGDEIALDEDADESQLSNASDSDLTDGEAVKESSKKSTGSSASGLFVEYNRQFYSVPRESILRDHNRRLVVESAEHLSSMTGTSTHSSKWPSG